MSGTRKLFRNVIPAAFAVLIAGGALGACSVTSGQQTGGEYVDDAALTTKVKSKLIADGGVTLANMVEVETLDEVVQLSGFVPSADDKARAGKIALQVEGVRAVRNDIIVK